MLKKHFKKLLWNQLNKAIYGTLATLAAVAAAKYGLHLDPVVVEGATALVTGLVVYFVPNIKPDAS